MKNYQIISGSDPDKVTQEVNRHLSDGAVLIVWVVTVCADFHNEIVFSQSVVYPWAKL